MINFRFLISSIKYSIFDKMRVKNSSLILQVDRFSIMDLFLSLHLLELYNLNEQPGKKVVGPKRKSLQVWVHPQNHQVQMRSASPLHHPLYVETQHQEHRNKNSLWSCPRHRRTSPRLNTFQHLHNRLQYRPPRVPGKVIVNRGEYVLQWVTEKTGLLPNRYEKYTRSHKH